MNTTEYKRRVVNISIMTHMKVLEYCQKHCFKVGVWADKVLGEALNKNQSPTMEVPSVTEKNTRHQEPVLDQSGIEE